jgi:hypothetical protein
MFITIFLLYLFSKPRSKLLSITTQLHCGGHLGGRAQLPDTILEEDHPMTIPSKFGFNWATGSRQDGFPDYAKRTFPCSCHLGNLSWQKYYYFITRRKMALSSVSVIPGFHLENVNATMELWRKFSRNYVLHTKRIWTKCCHMHCLLIERRQYLEVGKPLGTLYPHQ